MDKRAARKAAAGKEMSFFDHLEELRWHLIRMAIAIVAAGVLLFIFRKEVFGVVFFWPFKGDFPTFEFLCTISDSFCFDEVPVTIQSVAPYEQFMKAMVYAFFGGIILTFPYLMWELWRFIKPGLTRPEVRKVRWNTFYTSLLFFIGIAFGYFVILPFSIKFFSVFQLVEGIKQDWRIGEVVNFIMLLLFGTGLLFQLPVIVFYLSKLGMISPRFLKKYRRHSIVVILGVAALITPPDPFSQVLIFIPLMLLYEIGIVLSRRVERAYIRQEEAYERERQQRISSSSSV